MTEREGGGGGVRQFRLGALVTVLQFKNNIIKKTIVCMYICVCVCVCVCVCADRPQVPGDTMIQPTQPYGLKKRSYDVSASSLDKTHSTHQMLGFNQMSDVTMNFKHVI